MKRLIVMALTVVLTAAALTGCGCTANVGEDTQPSTTVAPTTEPTTAPTTEPTTAPTTGPTTMPTTQPTDPSDTETVYPDTNGSTDNMTDGAVMPDGTGDTGMTDGVLGRSRGIRRR